MAFLITIGTMSFVGLIAFEVAVVKVMVCISANGAAWGGPAVVCSVAKPPASSTLSRVRDVLLDFNLFKANSDHWWKCPAFKRDGGT